MARMTLKAVHGDGERRRLPLSERIVDEHLSSYRHVPQPPERLRSATADAEALEPRSADLAEDHEDDHAGHAQVDDRATRRNRHRPHGDERGEELVDAAWLYAWSYADRRASRGVADRTTRRGRLSRLGTHRGLSLPARGRNR
jgi:hypothetical protein